MARAIALIAIASIIVVAALTWCVIVHRDKVAVREQRRLDHMQSTLREIDSLLLSYTPSDAMGDDLEKQAREILADYHMVLSVSAGRKRHLDAAQTARERLAVLLTEYPQSLFAPSDDVSKKFVREVFGALYPAQPKEIPHVP
jgi:hypothetical protein